MDENRLREMLEGVKAGSVPVDDAVSEIRKLPYKDIGFAKVDHHRELRTGYPEVVFCQGKTPGQVRMIVAELLTEGPNVLATRATREVYEEVLKAAADAEYNAIAKTVTIRRKPARTPAEGAGGARIPEDAHRAHLQEDAPGAHGTDERDRYICVVSAGTSDLPVAEEACVTAEILGNRVERLYDVGVAGIHRLLSNAGVLYAANVIIVVAGMEGALASVVGGLVDKPVVAVPTSVGYGANFGGLSALLTMLNSCASGVGVVNIDNGFGAGYLASLINRL